MEVNDNQRFQILWGKSRCLISVLQKEFKNGFLPYKQIF